MFFWILATALAVGVAAVLGLTLRQQVPEQPTQDHDLRVYRDQLAGVERDMARGVLGQDEADQLRTEISRRILAADAAMRNAAPQMQGPGNSLLLTGLLLAVLGGGSLWLYTLFGAPGYGDMALATRVEAAETRRQTRPSQAQFEADLPAGTLPAPDVGDDYRALVRQLRDTVAERPDDAEGFRLLAISERNLGNAGAAHAAFARYLQLRGDTASGAEWAQYAELLVRAAAGYVSPQAEMAIGRALELQPGNGVARYFSGMMHIQIGRPDRALMLWDQLLRDAQGDEPWLPSVREQIGDLAQLAGQPNYTAPSGLRGPGTDDIAAANQMSPEDRAAMIENMVNGLAARLGDEGGPPEEWARLINALGVLGRTDDARAVHADALNVFADDSAALALIAQAARRAGLTE